MKTKHHFPDTPKMVESTYHYFGPYQTDKEFEQSKDLLQKGDEFQEPTHYRTKGAGVEWATILPSRVGGKPCKECRYRRKVR